MTIGTGDLAPNFRLPAVGRKPYSLGETVALGWNVLLVFLRHLG